MAKITVLFGAMLIALGLLGYFGTPAGGSDEVAVATEGAAGEGAGAKATAKRSVTALIPAFVGIAIAACGLIAFRESARKHAMHAAVAIGLLGFLAGGSRVMTGLGKVLQSDPDVNWRSFTFVLLMTLVCATFVAFCISSFLQARRERKEEEAAAQRQ